MTDPKSMERLSARFQVFRDKHPVRLLYSFWCDEIEPLSVNDLPTAYKAWEGQYPNFGFSPASGHQGLMVPGSKDQLTKENVLGVCKAAAKTLNNELENHGFDPDSRIANPEVNWLWALVQAAGNRHLGFEGFQDQERMIAFNDEGCTFGESMIGQDAFEWCDDSLLPRMYMQIPNIVEASLSLLDHLGTEPKTKPEQKPKRGNKVCPDEVLAHYVENEPFWCMTHDIDEIAVRSGFSEGAISGSDVYKEKIRPMQKKAGTFRKNKKKLRAALESGEVALLNENQKASYEYLKSCVEDTGFDEDDDL